MGRKSENIFKQENGHAEPLLKYVVYQYLGELRRTYRRATTTKYEGQLLNYITPEFGKKHVSTRGIIFFVHRLLAGDGIYRSNGNARCSRNNKALSPRTMLFLSWELVQDAGRVY